MILWSEIRLTSSKKNEIFCFLIICFVQLTNLTRTILPNSTWTKLKKANFRISTINLICTPTSSYRNMYSRYKTETENKRKRRSNLRHIYMPYMTPRQPAQLSKYRWDRKLPDLPVPNLVSCMPIKTFWLFELTKKK